MEKKRYVAPLMECMGMESELPVCVSPGVTGGGMGYGGVDKEGGKDPGAQQRIIEDMESGSSEELW